MRRWMTGWDLRDRWNISITDLADIVICGELRAYEPETLAPLDLQEEIEYLSYVESYPDAPDIAVIPTLIQRAGELNFRVSDIAEYEKAHNIQPGTTAEPAQSHLKSAAPRTAEQFIQEQTGKGEPKEIIAWQLWDRQGEFRMADLEIARALKLDDNLHEGQLAAKKTRSKRLRDKGELLLAARKKLKR